MRAGISRLDAFLATHAHYDHAMDAVEISRLTGCRLVGSQTFASLCRGYGAPADAVEVVSGGDHRLIGPFRVEWVMSRHMQPDLARGELPAAPRAPMRASQMRSGSTFFLRLDLPNGSIGILGSAGFHSGMFANQKVGILFLAAAGLGRASAHELEKFFAETVLSTDARVVIPTHWDNFFQPAGERAAPFPAWLDNTPRTLNRLSRLCEAHGITFFLPPFFEPLCLPDDVK